MKTIKNLQLVTWMLIALHVSGFNVIQNEFDSHESKIELGNNDPMLVIKNDRGEIIYRAPAAAGLEEPSDFDLRTLPDGKYVMELESNVEIKVRPFQVQTGYVSFEKASKIFKPVVNSRDQLVYVSKLAFDNSRLKVEIYDKYHDLVFSEILKNKEMNGRIYDFSGLRGDHFEVVVRTDGRVYNQILEF